MANHYLDGVLLEEAPLGFTEPTEEEVTAQNTAIKEEMQTFVCPQHLVRK